MSERKQEQDGQEQDGQEQDEGRGGTAEPRSLRVESDQDQPEDAGFDGGDQDLVQPVPD